MKKQGLGLNNLPQARNSLIISFIALSLFSCGSKKDIDRISEAQDCLNQSTSTTALACQEKVSGMSSQAADMIRCVSIYNAQGYTDPTKLTTIATQMGSTGSSAVNTMMSALAFASSSFSSTQNLQLARDASTYCSNSGSKALVVLSSISRIATETLNLTSGIDPNNPPSAAQIKSAMCTTNGSSTDSSSSAKYIIGSAAVVAYQSGCNGTGGTTSNPFCTQVKSAVGGNTSDPTAVGAAISSVLCSQ